MNAAGLDSSAGLAFSAYAPTPLTEAWSLARSQQGEPVERLTRRFTFVEHALRLLVSVLDAERVSLGLPAPGARDQLVDRLDRPTLGLRAAAVRALASLIVRHPDTQLRPLLEAIGSGEELTPSDQALRELITLRNTFAHELQLCPPEQTTLELLDQTTPLLRTFILGLDALKQTPLVVVERIDDRLDGRAEARILVFQGPEPRLLPLQERPSAPARRPALLTQTGALISLAPWVMFSDFGESGPAHLRTLDTWAKDGPTYSRAGASRAATPAELRDRRAEKVLSELSALPRAAQHGLAALWRRLVRQDDPQPPPYLPGYRVERLLGRGASGAVWLARDQTTLRPVALKILHPVLAESPQQRARLEREHALLRRVTHPGVARVYELLPSTPLGPVLVMEAVEGQPLDERCAERPLDPTTAARLSARVLHALGALHAMGLVHRDVKPANILIDARGEPRLVDFGVARAEGLSNITGSMDVVGTQAYAAPEQLLGGEVDGRADLFAVGRMLPTLCSADGDWGARLGRLPGALQCIVRRATQQDPASRYPNALAMQRDLEAREVEGWDGPPVGVGDLLPGGLRLLRQVDELLESVWLFAALPVAGGPEIGVLVAGGGRAGWDELARRLEACKPETRHAARCGGLRLGEDGLAYAELRGDQPELWARRLLGLPEPEQKAETKTEWSDTGRLAAAVGGVAALAAGAAATAGLSLWLRRTLVKSAEAGRVASSTPPPTPTPSAPAGPPLSRELLLRHAQGLGLLLHAIAHAARETHLDEPTWAKLCSSALDAPLRVLGQEGESWCGPVGQTLARLEGRSGLLAGITGLIQPTPSPLALKSAERAVGALSQVVDTTLSQRGALNTLPFARPATEGGWEILRIVDGARLWTRVR